MIDVLNALFLDFDGVINSNRFLQGLHWAGGVKPMFSDKDFVEMIDPAAVKRVDKICDETGARIVISSSWRNHFPLITLERFLRDKGCEGLSPIGTTPGYRHLSDGRGEQVGYWLQAYGLYANVVGLDDNAYQIPGHPGRMYQTAFEFGLTDDDVEKIIELFENPLPIVD